MRLGGICTTKSDQTCDSIASEDEEDTRQDCGLFGYGGVIEVTGSGFQAGRSCGGRGAAQPARSQCYRGTCCVGLVGHRCGGSGWWLQLDAEVVLKAPVLELEH
jgi:hypothetical protein